MNIIPTDEEVLIREAEMYARQLNAYRRACKKADESFKEWSSKSWWYRFFHGYSGFPTPIMAMPTKHRIIAERLKLID